MQAEKVGRVPAEVIHLIRWLVTQKIEGLGPVDTLGREGEAS